MATSPRRTWIERMKGAALLAIDAYEDLEAYQTATGQAAGVVALVAGAQAIGGAGGGDSGTLAGLMSALLGWLLWAGITYLIGAKLLSSTFAVLRGMKLADESFSPPAGFAIYAAGARA